MEQNAHVKEQNAHVKEQNAHCTVTNYTFDSFFKIMVKQGKTICFVTTSNTIILIKYNWAKQNKNGEGTLGKGVYGFPCIPV